MEKVASLLDAPAVHDRRLLTIAGWFRTGAETYVLQDQGGKIETNIDRLIWVDEISYIEASEKLFQRSERLSPKERLSPQEEELYKHLMGSKWAKPVKVVVRGEFQTSTEPRFGHMNGFKHRLILYKVLQIEGN